MSLLSFYSKIQLKIEKVKKKLRWLHSGGSPVEPECGTSQKGSTALTGLWNQHFLKLQLLFWQSVKVVVRVFALIFGDSSENFLIFTRLGKDSVFVCNNFQEFPLCKRGLGGFLKGEVLQQDGVCGDFDLHSDRDECFVFVSAGETVKPGGG